MVTALLGVIYWPVMDGVYPFENMYWSYIYLKCQTRGYYLKKKKKNKGKKKHFNYSTVECLNLIGMTVLFLQQHHHRHHLSSKPHVYVNMLIRIHVHFIPITNTGTFTVPDNKLQVLSYWHQEKWKKKKTLVIKRPFIAAIM